MSFEADKEMYVTKRNGSREAISFDKILRRVKKLGEEIRTSLRNDQPKQSSNASINYTNLVMKVIDQLYDGITTTQIDELTAEQCASWSSIHPDYNALAGRIIISNHHKSTNVSFVKTMKKLYNHTDKHGNLAPLISQELYNIICMHAKAIDTWCDYSRDYLIDYFGFKTLLRSYMMKLGKVIVERPQHMWLRVALGIHGNDLERAKETYEMMSQKQFTHATPTLFNAGTPHPQLSSCFLSAMESDSIDGIFNTLKDCALISKWAGGIGLHIHNIRASGSHINGTNGTSNGIVPLLKVFNNTAKYVDQCVTPDTIIYTNHGPQAIRDVIPGETQIVNITGEMEVIEKVLEHSYNGEILYIYTKNDIRSLIITPEHPILVARNDDLIFEWVDAKDLVPSSDKLVYPIPTYSKDCEYLSADDCYVYGLLLARGDTNWIQTDRLYVYEYMIEYLTKKMIHFNVNVTNDNDNDDFHLIQWATNLNLVTSLCHSDLYNVAGQKHICSRMLNLPIEKAKYILKGIMDAVGVYGSDTKKMSHLAGGHMSFEMHSLDIVESCRYLFLKMGIFMTFVYDKASWSYIVDIPVCDETCMLFDIQIDDQIRPITCYSKRGNYLLVEIDSIKGDHYKGILYDLEMKNQHNYLLSGGLVHNGGGKRNGSFAIYLEPWHADVEKFLQMKRNTGDEELKARDLFYALWIPDLFMKRVKAGEKWTLMCPDECRGLSDVYGDEFESLYEKYETEGKGRVTINARDLWFQILDSQMETGTPYLLYKDAANRKSNQKNLGTIKSSNLCVAPETMILTDRGYLEIKSLNGKKVNVWNGKEFSKTEIVKTGTNKSLIEVHTNDHSILHCTTYHRFLIQSQTPSQSYVVVEANNLKKGDKIVNCSFPVIDGHVTLVSAYNHGYKCGDANLNENRRTYYLVPINYSIQSKMEWLSGYSDSCSCLVYGRDEQILRLMSENQEITMNIKYMLQTCGINPNIIKPESSPSVFQIIINASDIGKLISLGYSPKLTDLSNFKLLCDETPNSNYYVTEIVDVIDRNRIDDTFCFNEPKEHTGIFNGIYTMNCTEIIQHSDAETTATCNLASIALPSCIEISVDSAPIYNFEKLHKIARIVTYNLNRVIDVNYYPIEKARCSNMRHRPIGIGVQGLADVFMMMNIPFSSDEAKTLNKQIFETIYHAALTESCDLAERDGTYESFAGSPASFGILQFDLWEHQQTNDRYDWKELKERIKKTGLRNSLLVAPMPTASTSQILGYNECIEPITSNIYSRRTLAGEFILTNKYLMHDLLNMGMWNEKMKNKIVANNGSIQSIDTIPMDIRNKYKTVWELPMKVLIDMAADRGVYICQSQSLNLWIEDPTYNSLTSMHFYSWSKGLKTGIYYLRRRAKHQAQQFTIEPEKANHGVCAEEEEENGVCEMCSA
jgi:ribonucleoside-diphosphate reductase alpha chain